MTYIICSYDKGGSLMTSSKPQGMALEALIQRGDAALAQAQAAGKDIAHFVIFDTVPCAGGLGPMANKPVYSSKKEAAA